MGPWGEKTGLGSLKKEVEKKKDNIFSLGDEVE